ncbi:ABC transporter ATP-binding protein [Candidatus Bipolaricaulota bacterium]|nr:ABC transporter ATP-binding protein [Candidatus Bipolaricaulota bacterium]
MSQGTLLRVIDLKKHYGQTKAVDGVGFSVPAASVFTLLGPNGAGKTTTLEMLEGIREPDSGDIEIFGESVKRITRPIKQRIGVLLQDGGFEPHLKVREILRMFASFFEHSLPVEDVLAHVALEDKAGALVRTLSGGQRQRLALGAALINDPELIFLDEPTTGLDPQARRNMWSIVTDLRSRGKTLILTTHYMEEAEVLSDLVCIMDHGSIIAQGSPRELTKAFGEETMVEFHIDDVSQQALDGLRACCKEYRVDGGIVTVETENLSATMETMFTWSRSASVPLDSLVVRQPNLEDVFLSLTGRRLRE